MASRMRRTAFAALGTLALASSLVLTGCADDEDDDDCDGMGTQQRSLQEIALAGSSTETDNFVELPNAASLPNPGSGPLALQANTQADGTVTLADGCGDNDDEDD